MANFIMYGFKRDEDFARLSLDALLRICKPNERIIFLDDSFDPVSEDFRIHIEARGVEYKRTYHPRCGNLIGPEHCRANFRILEQYSAEANDGVCVKVDCDTMVFDRTWLDEFIADDTKKLVGGFHSQINYMFGMCYAIKHDLAEMLVADAIENPPWIHCFEDYEVSQRVHAAYPDLIKRYQLAKPHESFWICLPPNEVPPNLRVDVMDVNRTSNRAQVLNVMENTLKRAIDMDRRKAQQNEKSNAMVGKENAPVASEEVCRGPIGVAPESGVREG